MSSLLRGYAQPTSNNIWSHGANLYDLDAIKAAFRGENGSGYSGPEPEYADNIILFDTLDNFNYATYELFYNADNTTYADSYIAHRDMGKRLYIGVKGSESRMIIMGLIKVANSVNVTAYGIIGLNISESTTNYWDGDIDVDLIRGAA